jgi:hypothetical protein
MHFGKHMQFSRQLVLVALLSGVSAPALADRPGFGDVFTFKVGGMDYTADAKFSTTILGNEEVELDLRDLDMDTDATNLWLGFNWQFADSWSLSGSYSSFEGDGSSVASEDGNFDDIEWSANAVLDSELDLEFFIIDLGWDFINTGRSHLGVGVGLHVSDVRTALSATVSVDVNGNPVAPVDLGASSSNVTAPLPNFHLRGGHRFGDSFYIGGKIGYFALEIDDVDGELVTASVFGEWRPGSGNFGVGLGYQLIDVDVTEDSSSRRKKLDMTGDGPILYLSVGF